MERTQRQLVYRILMREGTAPQRVGRHVLHFLLGGLLVLGGSYFLMEICELRFCQPFRHEHMHKVRYFQEKVSAVDVVYVGSSQIHYGVMPRVVADEAQRLGKPVGPQYNLGVPGAELEVSWILSRDVVKGPRQPRLLVVGVMPLLCAANDEGTPELVAHFGNLWDVAGRVESGDLPVTSLAAASFRGMETLLQYPVYAARKPLKQFRWDYLQESAGGWWLPSDAAAVAQRSDEQWARLYTLHGSPKVLRYDETSRPARLLRAFRDVAVERGMELLVVYVPQLPDYVGKIYPKAGEARFRKWMETFCTAEGIAYRDLSDPADYTCSDFHDPVHLNAQGAMKFSRRLAREVATFLPSDR